MPENHTYERTIVPLIESVYNHFTPVERSIADFFIHNTEKADFSAKAIAQKLFVSEASLSRFAQKCGYSGYREFVYHYSNGFTQPREGVDDLTKGVLSTYQELLNKCFALMDAAQIRRAAELLGEASKVYVYGMGSSGMVAREFKLRFMRLGLDVEVIDDLHMMKMNAALVKPGQLLIGISISAQTEEIIDGLILARRRDAHTLLITANNDPAFHTFCDEVLLVGVTKNLNAGNVISPQFPALVMVDLLFANFLYSDTCNRSALYTDTLCALRRSVSKGLANGEGENILKDY